MRMRDWAESGQLPGGHGKASGQVSHEAPRRAAQTEKTERWSEKEDRPQEPRGGVGVLKAKSFSLGVSR